MGIKEILSKFVSRREKFNEMKDDERFRTKLTERSMSADERELARYLKENHDLKVKMAVEKFRKKKNDEIWHGKTALDAKNIFKNQKKIFARSPVIKDQFQKERELFFR